MTEGESPAEGVLRRHRRGAIEIWTLNRPARANALSRALVHALLEAAHQIAADPTVRAVVLEGEGSRAFSAGADLKERAGMDEETVRTVLDELRAAFDAIDRLPIPVVAAIDGVALGGGFELALTCDFRVASSTAELGLPEVSLAIIPGAGGTQRLTRLVGAARAKEWILLSRRLSGEEAAALGVVTRIAPEGTSVLDEALRLAESLAALPPIAVAAALEAIDGGVPLPLAEGLAHERRCYERTLVSEDRREALAAFREKRPPVFRGR